MDQAFLEELIGALEAHLGRMSRPDPAAVPVPATEVYLPPRYCSSCLRGWGDFAVFSDLKLAAGAAPTDVMAGFGARRACCMRALLGPTQFNLGDFPPLSVLQIGAGQVDAGSLIRVTQARAPCLAACPEGTRGRTQHGLAQLRLFASRASSTSGAASPFGTSVSSVEPAIPGKPGGEEAAALGSGDDASAAELVYTQAPLDLAWLASFLSRP